MLPCLSREHVNRACGLGLFCVGIKRGKVFTSRASSRNGDPPLFFPLFLLFPLYHTLLGSPGGQGGTPWVGEVVTISAGDQEVTLLPALRPGWSFEVVSQLSCPHLNVQPPIRGEGLPLQPGAGRGVGLGAPARAAADTRWASNHRMPFAGPENPHRTFLGDADASGTCAGDTWRHR